MNRRRQGALGEKIAAAYLERKGGEILARNVVRPGGEIDLIVRFGETIAFVEVKRRTSTRYGTPAEAVTPAKQKRIFHTALYYIQENALEEAKLRFDVVEITPEGIRHIESAFGELSGYD